MGFFNETVKRYYDRVVTTFNLLIHQRKPPSLEDFADEVMSVGELIKSCHDEIVPLYNDDLYSEHAEGMETLTETLHEYRMALKNILKYIRIRQSQERV